MHARVSQQVTQTGVQHVLADLNSTCGTYVNGMSVDPEGAGVVLRHGDVISLGPSQTSTYVYYCARPTRTQVRAKDVSWVWVPEES